MFCERGEKQKTCDGEDPVFTHLKYVLCVATLYD